MSAERAGWRKLGPGIYLDQDGDVQVFENEILAHFGVPESEEAFVWIERVLAEVLAEQFPRADVVFVG